MPKPLLRSSNKQPRKRKSTGPRADKLPFGQSLVAVTQVEDKVYENSGLCLDELRFTFADAVLVLRPVPDSDEIDVRVEAAPANGATGMPRWCRDLAGQVLQTAWLCDNAQGYRDQVVLAFDSLSPTVAIVCEGSVLKVFRHTLVSSAK